MWNNIEDEAERGDEGENTAEQPQPPQRFPSTMGIDTFGEDETASPERIPQSTEPTTQAAGSGPRTTQLQVNLIYYVLVTKLAEIEATLNIHEVCPILYTLLYQLQCRYLRGQIVIGAVDRNIPAIPTGISVVGSTRSEFVYTCSALTHTLLDSEFRYPIVSLVNKLFEIVNSEGASTDELRIRTRLETQLKTYVRNQTQLIMVNQMREQAAGIIDRRNAAIFEITIPPVNAQTIQRANVIRRRRAAVVDRPDPEDLDNDQNLQAAISMSLDEYFDHFTVPAQSTQTNNHTTTHTNVQSEVNYTELPDLSCAIMLSEHYYSTGSKWCKFGHVVCTSCIRSMPNSNSCPLCRSNLYESVVLLNMLEQKYGRHYQWTEMEEEDTVATSIERVVNQTDVTEEDTAATSIERVVNQTEVDTVSEVIESVVAVQDGMYNFAQHPIIDAVRNIEIVYLNRIC